MREPDLGVAHALFGAFRLGRGHLERGARAIEVAPRGDALRKEFVAPLALA